MRRHIECIVLVVAAMIGLAAVIAGLWIATLSGSWTLPIFGAATVCVAYRVWRTLPAAYDGVGP